LLDAMQHQDRELAKDQGINTGRMFYDAQAKELGTKGVLPPYTVSSLLVATADEDFVKRFDEESKKHDTFTLATPPGYELVLEKPAEKGVSFDPAKNVLTIEKKPDEAVRVDVLGGASPPELRKALEELREKSLAARVSGWWLILSYLLATLGELLLSPVGLSMVTKLAPARFASLFMGVWMLASSVAQYAGGTIGELWSKMTPTTFFEVFVASSLVAALVLAGLVIPLRKLMHEVV
jgi:POT family proton-dependent oligopeptide transporter